MTKQKRTALNPYGIVSIDMVLDKKMTFQQMKVFIALSSFQGMNENSFPSLNEISKRCGISPKEISKFTKQLEENGWITKIRRGKSISNVYTCLYSTGDSGEMHESEYKSDSGDLRGTDSGDLRGTDSGDSPDSILKEQIKEHLKEQGVSADAPTPKRNKLNTEQSIKLKELITLFAERYKYIYKGKSILLTGKEIGCIKTLASKQPIEEIKERIKYLEWKVERNPEYFSLTPSCLLNNYNKLTEARDRYDN